MKLLLTAIGKRVQLIKHLKKTFHVIGVDCSSETAAMHFVDVFHTVPRYTDMPYAGKILEICRREKVDVVLPLFEPEFRILDSVRNQLKEEGTFLMLSSPRVLAICDDKWDTYQFFVRQQFDTPQSFLKPEQHSGGFPIFLKPRIGMGSQHAYKVNSGEELSYLLNIVKDPIFQEYVQGTEYTIDCICNLKGQPVAVVPRERLEVRSGEVTKTRTVKDEALIQAAAAVCRRLGGIGPLTLQCIRTREGSLKWIEINPRVGGGVPLTFEAGVDYGQILKEMALGKEIPPRIGEFKELTMLRYDEAVFV